MKLNIAKKLIGGFMLVSLILFALVLFALFGISLIHRNMEVMLEEAWPTSEAVMEMRVDFIEKGNARAILMNGEPEKAREYSDKMDEKILQVMAMAKKDALLPSETLIQLEASNARINTYFERLVTLSSNGGVLKLIKSKELRDYDASLVTIGAFFERLEREIDGRTKFAINQSHSIVMLVRFLLVLFTAIALFITIMLGVLITRTIVNPVIELTAATEFVANGDLTSKINVKNNDEIGVLARNFKLMIMNLSDILKKTKEAVGQISTASSNILGSSQQQASGAKQQAAAVAETTSAALELSKTSEQIGESIKRVSMAAGHALHGMEKIKDAISRTGERIISLNERSREIGKITELINDVADQTNLLAVNAAIEAARAGEQGRGFSVVADEIRKLSDSTSRSTKDISSLVELIQHDITNAIMSMEQSVTNVNEEIKLSRDSAESAKEIAMSATQQIIGSKQIAEAMSSINDAMKEISNDAQQAQGTAKELSSLASELKLLTSKFKVNS